MTHPDPDVLERCETLVEAAIAEVNGRFPDWRPSDVQLGYARSVAKALAPIVAEACAKVAEDMKADFLSEEYATHQPLSSFGERFACDQVGKSIRHHFAKAEPAATQGGGS